MYHTSLNNKNKVDFDSFQEVDYFSCEGNIAMFNDITKGLPKQFKNVEVLYSEIAWHFGLHSFNDRAGIDNSAKLYYSKIDEAIINSQKPCIIVAGKKEGKYFSYDSSMEISLNGGKSIAYIWNLNLNLFELSKKTEDLIEILSNHFNSIGDFCCGFGNAGFYFLSKGKTFVVSDYNKRCIGYIKEQFRTYKKGGQ